MSSRSTRIALSFLSTTMLVSVVSTTPVLGAKKSKPTEPEGPPPPIVVLAGRQDRMANTSMAGRLTRIADGGGDQALADGSPAPDAPAWTDIEAVTMAPSQMPAKLLSTMASDFPVGTLGAFYGAQADWQKGDPGVFVAVKMADRLPREVQGQQVEVGIGGSGATAMGADSETDPRAGVERFSLSGVFNNGAFATGTTDVSGRQPGDAIEYYNTESGVFGFYQTKTSTWYLVVPRQKDTDSVVVSVRSSTDAGEVIDRLELPAGGHFIDFADPASGWDKKAGLPTLECRSLETYSAAGAEAAGLQMADPEGTLIRYTAGMDRAGDAEQIATLLQPAIDAMGSIPVALTAVGAEADAAPIVVDADLAVAPAQNAVSLTFEAPAGQWTFALADGAELTTPAGEAIIDHTSLTGAAGLRTGPGLDGFVAGDLSCVIADSEIPGTDTAQPADTDTAQPADTDTPAPADETDAADDQSADP